MRRSLLGCLLLATSAFAADPVPLARDGKALLPVVTAKTAPERVRKMADTLAAYLARMSGAKFVVEAGDGSKGIVVGRAEDFPSLKIRVPWQANALTAREDYILRSQPTGVLVLGATELAVEHACWDLLYRLGHRQFFPGETWEVVPRRAELALAVDVHEHPAYLGRRIWYGYGAWDYAAEPYRDWCAKNRAVMGVDLHTGHAYDGMLKRNQKEFDAHPEYLGLVGGQRKSSKFCIANPDLRKLIVKDALDHFARTPGLDSVSVDPSDGGGWCECPQCKALGSVSDRALTLANDVAAAVTAKHGQKLIGMYAYSQHSPPPTIKVHPNVVISVATSFITGGYSVDQLMDGWHKQGATLGVREYYAVSTWDRDLPGAARGSRLQYLAQTIPHFHERGARYFSAEASDNWGPNGLGYYVAGRLLWDVKEAKRIDDIVNDFLDRAFGTARGPMAEFYKLIDGTRKPLLCDDLIGRMYRHLAEAQKKTDDPAVRRRIDDLMLYTRYVELWSDYAAGQGDARQKAFEAVIRHVYRMRKTMMVHSKALYRDVAARDKSVSIPNGATWNVPEGRNPWKDGSAFSREELDGLVTKGIANRKLFDFEPVAFRQELVPATPLKLPEVAKAGNFGTYSRGSRTYFTWITKAPATLRVKAKAGLIYGNRGPAKLALYPAQEPEGKAVAHAEVAPDKEEKSVELKTTFAGLHRLEVSDGSAGTAVSFAEGTPVTLWSSPEQPATLHGRWSAYFYVPKGTKTVGGFASGTGLLRDGSGKQVHTFDKKAGYFSVRVPEGEDGKLWKFENSVGQRLLMTVPPCLAREARELLLPEEVVKAVKPPR